MGTPQTIAAVNERNWSCPVDPALIGAILADAVTCGAAQIDLTDNIGQARERALPVASADRDHGVSITPYTVTVPVLVNGAVVATIWAVGTSGESEDLAQAANMASKRLADAWRAALEIDSLAGEVLRTYEELHLLYELGEVLTGQLTVAQVVGLILERILHAMRASRAELRLTDPSVPIYVQSQRQDEQHGEPQYGDWHSLRAMLRSGGQTVGSIAILRPPADVPFSAADGKLLDAVGTFAGGVIWNAQLHRQVSTDPLTGLLNHRAIQERFDTALQDACACGTTLGVVMLDLDDFKLFNDTYGHLIGDAVLRLLSEALQATCRETDVLGRYGGDEFIFLLPGADRDRVTTIAHRILDAMADQAIPLPTGEELAVVLSLGFAIFPEDGHGKQELLSRADAALYEAKHRGGNAVIGFRDEQGMLGADNALLNTSTTFDALQGLVNAVDAKDRYTGEHSTLVADAAILLARQLGLPETAYVTLRVAGQLHDVGKIGIPDRILRKPGALTADEYAVMRQHVELSTLIIKEVPNCAAVLEAVACHHERYDGRGYPLGLRGEAIPLLGRILALADGCAAMLANRPYRRGRPWPEVVQELRRGSGTQFDPDLVEPFIDALEASTLVARALPKPDRSPELV